MTLRVPVDRLRFKAPIAAGMNPYTLMALVPLLRNTSQDHGPIPGQPTLPHLR